MPPKGKTAVAPQSAPRSDEPGSDTQERILNAAIGEFGQHGYVGASTARIVSRAGCNVRMLYHYYGDKLGLYRAALERVYLALRRAEAAENFEDLSPEEGVRAFVRFTFDYMLDHPEFPLLMRVENMNEGQVVREIGSVFESSRPLMRRLGALVDQGVETGVFRNRIAPEQLYLSILGLSFVHISNSYTASVLLGLDFTAPTFVETRRREAVALILGHLKSLADSTDHGR